MINEKTNIQERVADALIETEEIKELKQEIKDKEIEIDDNEDWGLDDREFDYELDSIYPEVEIAGHKYSTSNALKNTDECMYDQMKMEMENQIREEKDEELQSELEELEELLEDLLDEQSEEEEI